MLSYFPVLLARLRAVCYTLARRYLRLSAVFLHGTAVHDEYENKAGPDRFIGHAERSVHKHRKKNFQNMVP